MPGPLAALGMQAAGQASGAAMGVIAGSINDGRQYKQQKRLQDLQIQGQQQMTDYNMRKQMEMWQNTSYPAQVEMMKKAGLNPALMYGMGGGGGATTGNASGSVSGATAQQNPGELTGMMGYGLQLQLLKAQKDNIEADTANKQADATLKGGAQTDNIRADTANKILDQVIKDYTGREAKDTYERVSAPNRAVQAETNLAEMEAKQAIAKTLVDRWNDGTLEGKSIAEMEAVALQNSKTREETKNIQKQFDILEQNLKGAKFDNIIKELETKLQTQTGIDKNSPAWMKILGRLFVQLMSN